MENPLLNEKDIEGFLSKDGDPVPIKKPDPSLLVEVKPEPTLESLPEVKKTFPLKTVRIWKKFFGYFGFFVLIFVLAFSVMNSPAIISQIKYFWETDYQGKNWSDESKFDTRNPYGVFATTEDKLVIPKIQVDAPILWEVDEGQVDSQLVNGIVHYADTALPTEPGTVYLSGHSSYYAWSTSLYKDVFALLNKLETGDNIYVVYKQRIYTYEVTAKNIMTPKDVEIISNSEEKDYKLTLITCVPLGTNLQRLVVEAKIVSE